MNFDKHIVQAVFYSEQQSAVMGYWSRSKSRYVLIDPSRSRFNYASRLVPREINESYKSLKPGDFLEIRSSGKWRVCILKRILKHSSKITQLQVVYLDDRSATRYPVLSSSQCWRRLSKPGSNIDSILNSILKPQPTGRVKSLNW